MNDCEISGRTVLAKCNGIVWAINPTKHDFPCKASDLIEACGFIPSFLNEGEIARVARSREDSGGRMTVEDIKDMLQEAYGFGALYAFGDNGKLSDLGVFSYPDDPDMYPLMQTYLRVYGFVHRIEILIYQYGIVAIRDDKTTFMTRMD